MLTLLLDGELESSQEPGIFAELAQNEELRAEFHDQMRFKEAASRDTDAFALPIGATAGVFSRLGFEAALKGTTAVGVGVVLKKLWLPLTTAIASAVLTFVAISGFGLGNSGTQSDIPRSTQSEETNLAANTSNQPSQAPTIIYRDVPPRIIFKRVPIVETQSAGNTVVSATDTTATKSIASELHTSYRVSPSASAILAPVSLRSPALAQYPEFDTEAEPFRHMETNPEPNSFYFTLRGMNSKSYPSTDEQLQTSQAFSNLAIGLFYEFGENHSVGMEIGQEPFTQLVNNPEQGYIRSEQNPILFWVGLSYRGTLSKIASLGDLQPYAQVTIGSTQVGPLGKAIVGLQYTTMSGFGINLGIEGSLLYYQINQTKDNTRKLGLTYGLQYKF